MSLRLKQHYHVLGLNPSASQEDVKARYEALAFETHPDKNPDSEGIAQVRFQAISDAYAKLITHFQLKLKPLPQIPISPAHEHTMIPEPLSPSAIPLPDSPIFETSPGPVTRSASRRRLMHLEATWQADSVRGIPPMISPLESPMAPRVPLKSRSRSVPRSLVRSQPQLAPGSPRRAVTTKHTIRNFSILWREPLSPTFAGIAKQHLSQERSIHDIRASIFATLTTLQDVASSTTKSVNDDAM